MFRSGIVVIFLTFWVPA